MLAGLQADTVLLIFTLAALAPAEQAIMLQNAYQVGFVLHFACMIGIPCSC